MLSDQVDLFLYVCERFLEGPPLLGFGRAVCEGFRYALPRL